MNIIQRLFGRREVKQSELSMDFPWPLIFSPSKLNEWLRRGLISSVSFENAWLLRRAVLKICDPVATMPIGLYRLGDEEELVPDDPVLTRLASPNPLMGQGDFFRAIQAHVLLSGNGYVLLEDSVIPAMGGNTSARRVKSMTPVPKEFVDTKIRGGVVSYEVRRGNGVEIVDSDHMVNVVAFNPASPINGVSVISGVKDILSTYQLSSKWNNNLLRNYGKPGGVFSTDRNLSADQKKWIKEQYAEKRKGADNAGKDLILDGGLTYREIAFSPSDMDWLNAKKLSIKEVALAFDIPPELMGDPESKTYNSMREAKKDFTETTILPATDSILSALNRKFWPDGKHALRVITSKVSSLQNSLSEMVTSLKDAWWLTPNQRLAAMNMEQGEDPSMDKVYIPSGYMPIDEVGVGIDDLMPDRDEPEPAEEPEDEE